MRADRAVWNIGDVPKLKIDIHNDGPKTWTSPALYDIEVDGVWYRYAGPVGVVCPGVKPGKGLMDIPFQLAGNPFLMTIDRKPDGTSLAPLSLPPGRHTIRVGFS